MKVDILASGSTGNCIALQSGDTTILIDAGIAKTKIEKRLLEVGIRADQVDAIFITHAHKDHTKGLPLANKYKIPVYAGYEEWKDIPFVDEEHQNIMNVLRDIRDFRVTAFPVHHDAYEPLGYTVSSNDTKVSICLDTGKVDEEMYLAMKDSHIYIIEANHDVDMVESSKYPNSVRTRILSDVGHLSNEQTAEALSKLIQGRGEMIYLTHLSSNNNLPALAEMTVKQALRAKGFVAGKGYDIKVV